MPLTKQKWYDESSYQQGLVEVQRHLAQLFSQEDTDQVLGWRNGTHPALDWQLIRAKAQEVREGAEVLVVIGVGGSNQATRALLEAIPRQSQLEIIYLGNTLSPLYIQQQLRKLEGKSVYLNVIAKNFQTLEPGSHFRLLYQWLLKHYSVEEAAKRVIVTGTPGSALHQLAEEQRFTFLAFPRDIGGRYSAFTAVTYFPIACAGLNIEDYHAGINRAVQFYQSSPQQGFALEYAVHRYLLYKKGFTLELMATFEPSLHYFTKWWQQLFGESEGKDGHGIYPSVVTYTEDLHSVGQYVQEGKRMIQETFLRVDELTEDVSFPEKAVFSDGFDYLVGKSFGEMNRIAEQSTIDAHLAGGVPCCEVEMTRIDEATMGYWYYTFMIACVLSSRLLGVNPFDQEGVEAYKERMFRSLGK